MATPQERVEADLKESMKAGERERTGALRMLLAAIKNERIERGEALDEDAFIAVVQRAIKQRQEAAELYHQGNRPELAEKEEREAEMLGRYLPEQVDEGEIRRAIRELVEAEGLEGPRAMGRVMQQMLERFHGRADGATINKIARDLLS